MRKIYAILFYGMLILSFGCSDKKYSPLDEVLELAGKNRHQLKRVIKHYSADPADSLKLKAAEFLILNMPGKYSEYYNAPWEDVATVNLRWSSSSDKTKVLETYKLGNKVRKEDIHHITAEYLISNIDLAFRVWNDKPWGKHVSFETFCEEILPYRIGTDPLENWREKVLTSFHDVDKSLKEDTLLTAVNACCKVNDILPRFRIDKDFANMSYTQLMATTRGTCDNFTLLTAFVMRGLGIPVTIDFTPHWKSGSTGHSWNSVCDSTGQHISFMGTETNPYVAHQGTELLKAKAYRKTYKNKLIVETDRAYIPPLFRNNIIDISAEHDSMTNAVIPVRYPSDIARDHAFLALFYDFEWRMTGHGNIDSDSIRYHHIGKDILYLPIHYANEIQTPAGDPFYADLDGEIHIMAADAGDSLISFSKITPEEDMQWNWRMENAVFESSEKSDFSDSIIIHKISGTHGLFNKVKLKQPHTCRYIRYRSPIGNCNVSEITFYDAEGNELKGNHIGSTESYNDLGDTGDKAFDGDITTFYDATVSENSWTGLDFGEQKTIASIHYSPRVLGIGIYEGFRYELFRWEDKGWKSTERKKAVGPTIEFNIPRNTLLYLYNNTTKKRGRVFFILDDKIFYY